MRKYLSAPARAITVKLCLILTLFIVPATAFAQDYDFSETKAIIDGYIKEDKLAGVVLLVMKDGKPILLHTSGMQDRETGTAMQKDSLFRIASQTKALTSVAIMILQERGLLDVTDPVSKYIPSFAKTNVISVKEDKSTEIVPAIREITIHDLLTHSSGINYGWGAAQEDWEKAGLVGWYFADKNQTIQQALAPIASLPNAAQPGEAFVYGYNTDILGAIVEIASGKSLKEFFESEITGPLGMKDTFFYVPEEKLSRLATVYSATDGAIVRTANAEDAANFRESQGHYAQGPRKAYSGGAGLASTASDYATLLNMLLNKGTLNGVKILTSATVDKMTINQIPYIAESRNDGFGYGFYITNSMEDESKGQTAEYGWGGAYHSKYYVRPIDGLVVVYLTQLIPAKGLEDWEAIDGAIKKAIGIE